MAVFSCVGCCPGYPCSCYYRYQHRGRAAPIYITEGFCVTHAPSSLVIWGGGVSSAFSLHSFLDELIQSHAYIHTSSEGAQVSVLFSQAWLSKELPPILRADSLAMLGPQNTAKLLPVKITVSSFVPRGVAAIPIPLVLHSRLASENQEAALLVLGLRSCNQQGIPEESEQSAGNWMTSV